MGIKSPTLAKLMARPLRCSHRQRGNLSPETCLARGKDIWLQNAKTNTEHTSGLHGLYGCYRLTFHPVIRYNLFLTHLPSQYPYFLIGITLPNYGTILPYTICAILLQKFYYSGVTIKTYAISMLFFGFSHIGGGSPAVLQKGKGRALG